MFSIDTTSSKLSGKSNVPYTLAPDDLLKFRPPPLSDVLLDVAPPPFTLSAFMAYLSRNYCMESLEFTLDSQRYTALYNEKITKNSDRTQDNNDRVCSLWEKLMLEYIVPNAPKEVNVPASTRIEMLGLPCGPIPPHPNHLDEIIRILYELMDDSLLIPFFQSISPQYIGKPTSQHLRGSRRYLDSNVLSRIRSSMNLLGHRILLDDSDCDSDQGVVLRITPTLTPISKRVVGSSVDVQRAVAARSNCWKSMGARLKFHRKSAGTRSVPNSPRHLAGSLDITL